MPLKLDVDQNTALYLDYSKVPIKSKEDLEKILGKIPDYRTRPEKMRVDELMITEKQFSFVTPKQQAEAKTPSSSKHDGYEFLNPVPLSMRKVPLGDISTVDINWHMLTMARPSTKFEEDYFNRIVYLERTTYRTVIKETEQATKAAARASKGKKGRGSRSHKVGSMVTETKHATCHECGEEFCNGTCKDYLYEIHARLPLADDDDEPQQQQPLEERGNVFVVAICLLVLRLPYLTVRLFQSLCKMVYLPKSKSHLEVLRSPRRPGNGQQMRQQDMGIDTAVEVESAIEAVSGAPLDYSHHQS